MKALFILLTISFAVNTNASVSCHTPRLNKIFEIKDSKVTFFHENESNGKRELASISSRNKSSEKGLTKIVQFENQKHIIHIEDIHRFSDTNDYIVIKSKTGHEITYPLTCENK